MGRAAKMYKRPSLKEKEQRKKARSSAQPSTDAQASKRDEGIRLEELKRQAREEQAIIAAKRAQQQQRAQQIAAISADGKELAEDEDAEQEAEEAAPKRTRRSGRAAKRYKVPEGEARTPKEAGIDYVKQWEGRRR